MHALTATYYTATYYNAGDKVWYRRSTSNTILSRGIIEEVVLGSPTVTYCVRLDGEDQIRANFVQLLPR